LFFANGETSAKDSLSPIQNPLVALRVQPHGLAFGSLARRPPRISTYSQVSFPRNSTNIPGYRSILQPSNAAQELAASATSPTGSEKIIVADGTMLALRLTESLSSELNEKGDTFWPA
jgi:hypothetical protein